ncbi:MAG: hypothetical protein E6G56_14355 [Actinobacteria bacterium]|nr:MAG: hypothetical protein E6G56_14355 [Actinomycetota bacterium]
MSRLRLANKLEGKVRVLNDRLWERRINGRLEAWLGNFDSADEELQALFLLSQFMYFGDREVRELLRAVYRDLFKYPIVEKVRRDHADTLDCDLLEREFARELSRTRFMGMGNPAESGTHLLYYFRQENHIPKSHFVAETELFDRRLDSPDSRLADPDIARLVFIDDFCGSGSQASIYSQRLLAVLRDVAQRSRQDLELCYFVLVGDGDGLDRVARETVFDRVDSVFKLDGSYKCLEPNSRHFAECPQGIGREASRQMAEKHGAKLFPSHPLGYDNGQLLLGFHHNVPDNSLPIMWYDDKPGTWSAILPRYPKIYG